MAPLYTEHVASQHYSCYIPAYESDMGPEEPKDRLRNARLAAGFTSAADAARYFGWPYSSYAAHENGQNDIRRKSAERYSRAFKVATSWLLTGEGSQATLSVPIEGHVGAGFVILPVGENQELERVEVPAGWGTGLKALKVRGRSMEPAYYPDDLIFYAPETDLRPPGELLGRECIIRLKSGEMYVKRLQKGSRADRFLLVSYNSDPIVDARIDWACPVKFIKRA